MDEQTYDSRDSQITGWVLSRCEDWRNQRDENYLEEWKAYERLWRGIWAGEDRTRDSERSRIVTPALQQAIETSVAEIEEAVFGRGEKPRMKFSYACCFTRRSATKFSFLLGCDCSLLRSAGTLRILSRHRNTGL